MGVPEPPHLGGGDPSKLCTHPPLTALPPFVVQLRTPSPLITAKIRGLSAHLVWRKSFVPQEQGESSEVTQS